MQVRCVFRRVARRADIPDHIPARDLLPVMQPLRVAIQMRIIKREPSRRVGSPYDISAERIRPDVEDPSVICRQHGRAALGEDIQRVVHARAVASRVVAIAPGFTGGISIAGRRRCVARARRFRRWLRQRCHRRERLERRTARDHREQERKGHRSTHHSLVTR